MHPGPYGQCKALPHESLVLLSRNGEVLVRGSGWQDVTGYYRMSTPSPHHDLHDPGKAPAHLASTQRQASSCQRALRPLKYQQRQRKQAPRLLSLLLIFFSDTGSHSEPSRALPLQSSCLSPTVCLDYRPCCHSRYLRPLVPKGSLGIFLPLWLYQEH